MLDSGDHRAFVACHELHERLLQFGVIHAAVGGNVEPGEEALVEEAAFSLGGLLVKLVAVGRQRQCRIEQPGQFFLGVRHGARSFVRLMQFTGEAIHLSLEHVERDGFGVVGFEQRLALVLQPRLLASGLGEVACRLLGLPGQFPNDCFPDERGACWAQLE